MINFVLFRRNPDTNFKLLDKDFSHVSCFIYDAVTWTCIDATHNRLAIKTYPAHTFKAEQLLEIDDVTHVLVQDVDESRHRSNFKFRLFNLFSCVTLAKYVCAVESSLIITPKQLYKHLIKQDNVEILI